MCPTSNTHEMLETGRRVHRAKKERNRVCENVKKDRGEQRRELDEQPSIRHSAHQAISNLLVTRNREDTRHATSIALPFNNPSK